MGSETRSEVHAEPKFPIALKSCPVELKHCFSDRSRRSDSKNLGFTPIGHEKGPFMTPKRSYTPLSGRFGAITGLFWCPVDLKPVDSDSSRRDLSEKLGFNSIGQEKGQSEILKRIQNGALPKISIYLRIGSFPTIYTPFERAVQRGYESDFQGRLRPWEKSKKRRSRKRFVNRKLLGKFICG